MAPDVSTTPGAPPQESTPVYLCPGQLAASAAPTSVTTIVGSCVAVCLWDPATGVGGVCHFQLPRWLGTGPRTQSYAEVAIQDLFDRLIALGARADNLRAKLFGGACLTPHVKRQHKPLGDENLEQALAQLRERGVGAVDLAEIGGHRARKVVVRTRDGEAIVKPL